MIHRFQTAQPVFVVNAPCSGTPVDTYTKDEIDAKICALGTRVDHLSTCEEDSVAIPNTPAFIMGEVVKLHEKVQKHGKKIAMLMALLADVDEDLDAIDTNPLNSAVAGEITEPEETKVTKHERDATEGEEDLKTPKKNKVK